MTGGESVVIDALAVVEKMRITHPHHFTTLVRVPATYHRIFHNKYSLYAHVKEFSLASKPYFCVK